MEILVVNARKRNGFNTGLTSQTSLHWDSLKTAMQSNTVTSSQY